MSIKKDTYQMILASDINGREVSADGKRFILKRFRCFGIKAYYKFNNAFIEVIITYQAMHKIIKEAKEIINPEFKNLSTGNKILSILKNPDDLVQYTFKMLIPLTRGRVLNEDVVIGRKRIARKIKRYRKLGIIF